MTAANLEVETLRFTLEQLKATQAAAQQQVSQHLAASEDAAKRASQAELDAQRLRHEGCYEQATIAAATASQLHKKARDNDMRAQAAGIQAEMAASELIACERKVEAACVNAAKVAADQDSLMKLTAEAATVRV